jgi:hypothetical protein
MKTKEQKQAEKARRAQLRAAAIELLVLTATAGSKGERYAALAMRCDDVKALLLEQAAGG